MPRERINKNESKNKAYLELMQSNKKMTNDHNIMSLKRYLQNQNILRDYRTINLEYPENNTNSSTLNYGMLPSI